MLPLLFALQGNETTNRGANNRLCADNIRIPAASSNTYLCRHKSYGRYLYIRIPGRETFLTLCEVEVYSHPKLESKSVILFFVFFFCRYATTTTIMVITIITIYLYSAYSLGVYK